MKAIRLKESCVQYKTTRNMYGDLVLGTGNTLLCLYRNITSLTRGVREEVGIVGSFWFSNSATVSRGDVIKYNGQLYRLENEVTAKTLLTQNVVTYLRFTASELRQLS